MPQEPFHPNAKSRKLKTGTNHPIGKVNKHVTKFYSNLSKLARTKRHKMVKSPIAIKRKRGRPKGSKNKPKIGLLSTVKKIIGVVHKKRGRPKGSKNKNKPIFKPEKFRREMGLDTKNKPTELAPLSKAIKKLSEEKIGIKRGRGRPKKEENSTPARKGFFKAKPVEEIKRKRGRPRKVVDEVKINSKETKRKPGRPKKEETPATSARKGFFKAKPVEEIKRKRGRPKKETPTINVKKSSVRRPRKSISKPVEKKPTPIKKPEAKKDSHTAKFEARMQELLKIHPKAMAKKKSPWYSSEFAKAAKKPFNFKPAKFKPKNYSLAKEKENNSLNDKFRNEISSKASVDYMLKNYLKHKPSHRD